MRIIAGEWKGRRLKSADGLRPTGDRVREALFSMLGGRLSGFFVDLYAGTGAVGLEACSRGATVTLVERDPASLEVARANLELLGRPEGVQLVADDALRFLKRPPSGERRARWIFADPPYDYGPYGKLLRTIAASPLTDAATEVIVEHRRGMRLGRGEPVRLVREETYGETTLSFFVADLSRSRASSSETSVS